MPGGDRSIARRTVLGGGAAALMAGSLPWSVGAARFSDEPPPATEAAFTTDIRLSGLLHAVIARPPLPGWLLATWEAGAVLVMKTVVAVIPLAPSAGPDLVRLGGVAVLARDTWSALRGRDALRPVWEAAAEISRDRPESFYVPETAEPLMEPPSATVRAGDDRCMVWTCTSDPTALRRSLAALLGLPLDAVTLHRTAGACDATRHANPAYAVEAALLSRAMGGAPVSLTWTVEDDMPFRRRSAWS